MSAKPTSTLPARALTENPFRILGVSPAATSREVEREGERLLGLIAADLDDTSSMPPLGGEQERTSEQVRWALGELRDPLKRTVHEFFWLSGQSLPLQTARVEALLKKVAFNLPGGQPMEALVRALGGELLPPLPAWKPPAEIAPRLEAALAVPPAPDLPPLCLEELELEAALHLPRQERNP